jgi:hypothetical protein
MSSAFHSQSNGQTEAANRVIGKYLRCFTGDRPREWLRWLSWAEYTYNTAYQSSLCDTPFRVVYGRDSPSIRSYEAGDTRVVAVAKTMAEREEFLAEVHNRLEQAQAVQKRHYDKSHRPVTYVVGDWVLLRLRSRSITSLSQTPKGKLQPRFFDPYRISEMINEVVVRLELPAQAKLHDVFHVGLFKNMGGHVVGLSSSTARGAQWGVGACPRACGALPRSLRGVQQVLVSWKGEPVSTATWEDLGDFTTKYSSFQLEDELVVEGGEMSCGVSPTPEDDVPGTSDGPLSAPRPGPPRKKTRNILFDKIERERIRS